VIIVENDDNRTLESILRVTEGSIDGIDVCMALGSKDGAANGKAVGSEVGISVGYDDGRRLGTILGVTNGLIDGDADGIDVGMNDTRIKRWCS
jgi:hypothetical protein